MTHFENTAPGAVDTRRSVSPFGRRQAATLLAVIALIGAIGVVGAATMSFGDRTAVDRVQARAGEIVDGWMAGITAANEAAARAEASADLVAANRVRDGWSAYLLRPEPEIVDGWSAYLLKPEAEIVDGWATRYLVADD
jgi:hypothetical protein